MLDILFLKDSPIFKDVSDEQFETLDFLVEEVAIPSGHFLFKEGAKASSLFIIRDGQIEVVKETNGQATVLAALGEGEVFGEMAVIRSTTRSTGARASGHTGLYTVNREKLDVLRQKDPVLWGTLMYNIAGVLSDRLAAITKQMTSKADGDDASAARSDEQKGFLARLIGH